MEYDGASKHERVVAATVCVSTIFSKFCFSSYF